MGNVKAIFPEPLGCFDCPMARKTDGNVYKTYCTLLKVYLKTYSHNEKECPLIKLEGGNNE